MVFDGDALKNAQYLLTRNITDIKDGKYYTEEEVNAMSPQEVTSLFRGMTMDTIQKTFLNDRNTQGKLERNDAFSDKTLEQYGVDRANLTTVKKNYEASLASKKISEL